MATTVMTELMTELTGNNSSQNVSAVGSGDYVSGKDSPVCVTYKLVFLVGIIGSLCVLGLIGNALSFAVFHMDRMKTSTSFLFQGLACIDSALLLLSMPLFAIEPLIGIYPLPHSRLWKVMAVKYLVIFPTTFVTQTATIWVTVLVGVNRYIAVCKPYQAPRLCSVGQAKKQLAVVLLCAVLYNVPRYAELHLVSGPNGTVDFNKTALSESDLYFTIYGNVCYLIFMMVLPLGILSLLNIRLIRALKQIKRRRAEMQSLRQQQDNNVTLVLIIVVVVFIICQLPAFFTQIFWTVLPDTSRLCGGFQFYFSPISNTLVVANSAVNFLIYFFFNTRFRQVLLHNICGRPQYEKVRGMTTTPGGATTMHSVLNDNTTPPKTNNDDVGDDDDDEGDKKAETSSAGLGEDSHESEAGLPYNESNGKCTQEASTSPLTTPR